MRPSQGWEPIYNLTVITPTAAIGDRAVRVKRDSQRGRGEGPADGRFSLADLEPVLAQRVEYDLPTGTPAPLNASPTTFASARPLSFSWRCCAMFPRFRGSVSAWQDTWHRGGTR